MTSEDSMRILTVRQPWAWAIIHGGKTVENRGRNIAGTYRGPIAIHAAQALDLSAFSGRVAALTAAAKAHTARTTDPMESGAWFHHRGHIIGVVDLVDVHHADDEACRSAVDGSPCSPWAERTGWHLVLENPRAVDQPIPLKGALGLRTLDDETTARVLAQIAPPAPRTFEDRFAEAIRRDQETGALPKPADETPTDHQFWSEA